MTSTSDLAPLPLAATLDDPSGWRLDTPDEPSAARRRASMRLALIAAASLVVHAVVVALIFSFDRTANHQPLAGREIPVEIVVEPAGGKPGDGKPGNGKPPGPASAAAKPATKRDVAPPPSTAVAGDRNGTGQTRGDASPPPAVTPPPPAETRPAEPPGPARPPPAQPPPKPAKLAPIDPSPFGFMPQSFQAAVLPPTSPTGSDKTSYRALVYGLLAKAKRYPESARRRGAGGVAVVSFSIDDAGNPYGIKLVRSSGHADIDAEVVAMVSRAAPFPPPPQGALRSFSPAIEFGLEQ